MAMYLEMFMQFVLICHPGFDGTLNAMWYPKEIEITWDGNKKATE